MKINITIGSSHFINGYLNIDPITGQDVEGAEAIRADVRNLDNLAMDSECKEIIAEDILDYLEKEDARAALSNWVSKLRHGGKIIVGGTDIYEACKQFYHRVIPLDEFNRIIHGTLENPWEVKLSHSTLFELETELKRLGIKILKKRINGLNMIIEGERP